MSQDIEDRIAQIQAAHQSARPNPAANPAWANAEHDIGVLLALITTLKAERDALCKTIWDAEAAMWGVHERGFVMGPLIERPSIADVVTDLKALVQSMRVALEPSGDTKAAYIGEFFEEIETYNPAHEDDSDEPETIIQRVPVSWTTIKQIMAAISARAALSRSEV